MAFNLQGAQPVHLTVFGGLVTGKDPITLPEGVSPACADVCFDHGSSVSSRPALQKVFATAFPKGSAALAASVTYGKSFCTPGGGIENLYLDSNGNLWWEDVINTPGTYTSIGTTTPGTYAKSATAFGREYIAISDGLHGQEVPLQWNPGTYSGGSWSGSWLDRVTQDGPGAPPTVSMFSLPTVTLGGSGTINLTVIEIDPIPVGLSSGNYNSLNLYITGSLGGLSIGSAVTIPSTTFAGTWTVTAIYPGSSSSLVVCSCNLSAPRTYWTGSGLTATAPIGGLNRSGNIVTANTTTAHGLKVGNQVVIAGVPAATVGGSTGFGDPGGVTSIVINNENQPGIATVTTSNAHGLAPGCQVSITGVYGVAVGGLIVSAYWSGGIARITTTANHNLAPGAVVTIGGIAGAGGTPFNGVWVVAQVTGPTSFTFSMPVVTAPSGAQTFTGSSTTLAWPIPDSASATVFEVLTCPTPTSFTVQVTYVDGTWVTGRVQQGWNGTYYVQSVPNSTTFTYQQAGPNNPSSTGWGIGGTATPFGQLSPGVHQCQIHFLTRNGYVTRPSPPVQFTSPGGQFLQVSNMAIGPPNVVARILAFTGAAGAFFFYIPAPPQAAGQIVGTATQINDNTTTSANLDFADNTLYAALGVSTAGNDLANQVLLDSCLGFAFFGSRLIAYGQRNRIQGFLNMGFEGGYVPGPGGATNQPAGWTGAMTSLSAGHYGVVCTGTSSQSISQPAYETASGAPILSPNTLYRFRCWATCAVGASLVSVSGSWTLSCSGTPPSGGGWVDVVFSGPTPNTINSDAMLAVTLLGNGSVDDISIVYAANPYLTDVAWASYVDNPEAFDGVTGVFGPADDTHQILEALGMSGSLYMLTQDPGGRVHRIANNGQEPAYWVVQQVGSNCGVLSAFGTAKSQGDDETGSGGEEWFAWASATGARIFDGSVPWKISQEIEPNWESVLPAATSTVWALNDPVGRQLYFGLPTGRISNCSAPDTVYICNYRELDAAYQIAQSAPIHTSYTGRLIATDHTRKWAPWLRTINGASLMYRAASQQKVVFLGGVGIFPGLSIGPANVYTLNPAKYTDDDYGGFNGTYTTFFFLPHDLAQAMHLDTRIMLAYFSIFASGLGALVVTPLIDTLANPWAQTMVRYPVAAPSHDLEWGGGNAAGYRIAFTISIRLASGFVTTNGTAVTWLSGDYFTGLSAGGSITISSVVYTILTVNSPTSVTLTASAGIGTYPWNTGTTDKWFNLQALMAAFKSAVHMPVRGSV